MIYDRISNLSLYSSLHPNLDTVIQYLSDLDTTKVTEGVNDVDGNQVFLVSQKNELVQNTVTPYEYHRKYTDIHIVTEGSELIKLGQGEFCEETPYDEKQDFGLLSCESSQQLLLEPGYFVLFYPGEPHLPGLTLVDKSMVKKYVVKVLFTEE